MTVYHRREDFPPDEWHHPNATFGHREDWAYWCYLCAIDQTIAVQGFRLEKALRFVADNIVSSSGEFYRNFVGR